MTHCVRAQLTGSVEVNLPPAAAFGLFTPTGERAWAHGWDPTFQGPASDETSPGTVFQTSHGGRRTIWTVTASEPGRAIAYSATTPGERAGLVTVTCQPSPAGTTATVSYDLTALTPEANAALASFADGYPQFLAHWEQSIAHAIAVS
jgi:Polyketide cyclase / dehydrase and lipid transport